MSEPVSDLLRRFTPDGSGLDRDALLFAAGRASARPGRGWKALVGALVASQLVTLGLWWPRSAPPGEPPVAVRAMIEPGAREPEIIREPSTLLTLRDRVLTADGDLPAPVVFESLLPPAPPLRAFDPLSAAIQ